MSRKTAAQYTPGPWSVGEETTWNPGNEFPIRDAAGAMVAMAKRGPWDSSRPDIWDSREANARLIAAAPDLLGKLKELRTALNLENALNPGYGWLEEVQALDALIAKAEGHD